ncbi:hypothetical protein WA026_004821 [Henosepilachna vigintioctopunctata]|uniref:Uncharacterized protein n=1 Tax=Henosepilachna vigintioctopunctata TaxID=420089 RepID=A0AAW1UM69_9CUCU
MSRTVPANLIAGSKPIARDRTRARRHLYSPGSAPSVLFWPPWGRPRRSSSLIDPSFQESRYSAEPQRKNPTKESPDLNSVTLEIRLFGTYA